MIQLIIVTNNAPMKAAEKVVTLKPRIKVPKYQKTKPFTIREKIPKVKTLIGKVRILIIGRKNILKRVRHAPTIRETQIGSTLTPEIICVVAQTATERIIQ